ncbi:MAG: DUF3445 domain-containing protein [Thiothrix sp.]|nr:MAG: DUF3445 domain-containing protein [Thiothrix sp.]
MPIFTPAPLIPWTVASPFKMRPGLSRLEEETTRLFQRDALAAQYAERKQQLLNEHRQRVLLGEAEPQVLVEIAQRYQQQTGIQLAAETEALTLGMQEDFVILHDELQGESFDMRTRFLSVCFPSNWSPSEKLGLNFHAIHIPVADNALLQAGAKGIIDLAFRKNTMLRHVWLLTPNSDLPSHPLQRARLWADVLQQVDQGSLLEQLYFRVERQTTLPLPDLKRGVFFIRVMIAPLVEVLRVEPERAKQLAEALRSMSDNILAYRGMTAALPRLLQELECFD